MALKVREDYRTLTGPEKAAILMLALGEEHSSKLFAMMDDEEIKELSQVMANLGTVSANLIERLFVEFAEQMSATGSLVGSFDSTERLLLKTLPKDKVDSIMEEIRGPAGRTMWDKLANVNESVLSNYLKNEYPQTVAVVLSKIRPEHAGRVLTQLPESFAMEVIMRMLRMEAVQKEVLDDVERTLRTEFMTNLARTSRRDSHEMLAEIFNGLDRTTEHRFMAALEERNRDSAERIKSLMFTFEDLSKLDPSGVQALLRSVDKQKLATALKGASETLKDLFFSNMSERAAKILREDMAAMGPVRVREVDESQMYMVQLAKDLAARGEIVISEGSGENSLIYWAGSRRGAPTLPLLAHGFPPSPALSGPKVRLPRQRKPKVCARAAQGRALSEASGVPSPASAGEGEGGGARPRDTLLHLRHPDRSTGISMALESLLEPHTLSPAFTPAGRTDVRTGIRDHSRGWKDSRSARPTCAGDGARSGLACRARGRELPCRPV